MPKCLLFILAGQCQSPGEHQAFGSPHSMLPAKTLQRPSPAMPKRRAQKATETELRETHLLTSRSTGYRVEHLAKPEGHAECLTNSQWGPTGPRNQQKRRGGKGGRGTPGNAPAPKDKPETQGRGGFLVSEDTGGHPGETSEPAYSKPCESTGQ